MRPNGGKIQIPIPGIEEPKFLHGDNGQKVGRGPGKKGDVVKRAPKPGQDTGGGAGDEASEGAIVSIDLEDVLQFLQDELALPDLKPKVNETHEDVKIVYNDISKVGPDSLRHNRRTLVETLKRLAQTGGGEYSKLPGEYRPTKKLLPISSDRRYRQYKEIKIPTSNAVILFIRDFSGSMDDFRCEIVNDMASWIEVWIKKFYEKTETAYIIHDSESKEVDRDTFYKIRNGGGTRVSTAFELASEWLGPERRFPVHKHNIYIFYFGDGDNYTKDNFKVIELLKKKFDPNDINLIGYAQITPDSDFDETLMHYLNSAISEGDFPEDWLRTVQIGKTDVSDFGEFTKYRVNHDMSEEERDEQVMNAIKQLLGKDRKKVKEDIGSGI